MILTSNNTCKYAFVPAGLLTTMFVQGDEMRCAKEAIE
jgi:hypothetical protein